MFKKLAEKNNNSFFNPIKINYRVNDNQSKKQTWLQGRFRPIFVTVSLLKKYNIQGRKQHAFKTEDYTSKKKKACLPLFN